MQNRSPSGPRSFPTPSKIDLNRVSASRSRGTSIKNRFWSDLGLLWEVILEPKLVLEAILKAFAKRSLIWYPSEEDVGLFLNGFWHLIGGQKGRSKQQENDYCRSFKIIDFPMEKHYFYYFERCPIAQKTSLFPSLRDPWWKDAIKFRKSTLLGPPLAWIWGLTRPPKAFRKGFRLASCFWSLFMSVHRAISASKSRPTPSSWGHPVGMNWVSPW